MGKLLCRHSAAEQDRHTTAVVRTFHVDAGVANEPNCVTRLNPTRLEREHNRSGIRLVDGRIPRPDDTAEECGPADLIRFATQQRTGFVADYSEKNPLSEKRSKQFAATRQRAQPIEM